MSKMFSDKEKLTEEKLIFGAGFIDDDLVDEALDYKPRRMSFIPWACTAAAAVVLVAAIAIIARLGGNTEVLPPDVVSSGLSTPNASTDPNASKDNEYSGGTSQCVPDDSSSNSGNSDNSSAPTVTTSDIPAEPIEDQKSYADTFEKFFGQENPATYGPPPTVEEIANRLTPNPDFPENDVDSYYLIEVVRALTNEEYELICGASTGINGNTLYEVILVEDWITGKAIDRKAYVEIPAGLGAAIQLKGDPTYASGEKFTAALTKPQENWNDIYSTGYDLMRSPCDYALRYDLPDMDFTEEDTEPMLYYRGRVPGRQPISDLPFTVEEINIEAAKSTPQNPATYIQKIVVSDFIDFLRELWQQAGLYVPEQNPPTVDIGNGMTLTGTPLDSSELEDLPAYNTVAWSFDSAERKFIDSIGINSFDALFERTMIFADYCLRSVAIPHTNAVSTLDVYIQDADGVRYYETGYTYDSFYDGYSRTFTKEINAELFEKHDPFLNYNGELFCSDRARDSRFGGIHSEYELIDKGNNYIKLRRMRFFENDSVTGGKYDPALREKYDLGITDFKFIQTNGIWRAANIPTEQYVDTSYLSPNEDFSADRVYPDDERVPSDWLPVMSLAECNNNISEIINSDTSDKDRESSIAALVNKSALCYELFYGVSRDLFNIDWDSPYDHPDFENPVYPFTSEYFSDIETVYELLYSTYERSVAERILYGRSANKEPIYAEKDGRMYINGESVPIWSSNPFISRSYVKITEKTDDICTFIWRYPDIEYLNYPPAGFEFYYFEKTYTAEYTEGSWKLTKVVFNNAESS